MLVANSAEGGTQEEARETGADSLWHGRAACPFQFYQLQLCFFSFEAHKLSLEFDVNFQNGICWIETEDLLGGIVKITIP